MSKVVILGSGGWGCAFAIMVANENHEVTLWSAFEKEIEVLSADNEHKKLLPGVKLPKNLALTTDLSVVSKADIIVNAVPSFAVREVAIRLRDYVKNGQIILNIAKGLEEGSLLRISEVIASELPSVKIASMSGPSHAEEVARGIPTVNVVASKNSDVANYIQSAFMSKVFRIYTTDDLVGLELGGSLKNVIALAAGVCDGMGYGDNTKAALMTRGIAEMVRLGVALGAKSETFTGLTGFGDLIVTCTSMHSRNRRAGILIGQGMSPDEAIKEIGMTVEGYKTTLAAHELAVKAGVNMPILNEIYDVLVNNKSPNEAILNLMTRDKKEEHQKEETWKDSE
ncbi:MAG: NAD(P)H-dependent glycerol-3-phosphate dehydrogenase [Clostridia bacterium]